MGTQRERERETETETETEWGYREIERQRETETETEWGHRESVWCGKGVVRAREGGREIVGVERECV